MWLRMLIVDTREAPWLERHSKAQGMDSLQRRSTLAAASSPPFGRCSVLKVALPLPPSFRFSVHLNYFCTPP